MVTYTLFPRPITYQTTFQLAFARFVACCTYCNALQLLSVMLATCRAVTCLFGPLWGHCFMLPCLLPQEMCLLLNILLSKQLNHVFWPHHMKALYTYFHEMQWLIQYRLTFALTVNGATEVPSLTCTVEIRHWWAILWAYGVSKFWCTLAQPTGLSKLKCLLFRIRYGLRGLMHSKYQTYPYNIS